MAVVLPDYAVCCGKAEPCAFSHFFRREKGLKYLFLSFTLYAGSGVRYAQQGKRRPRENVSDRFDFGVGQRLVRLDEQLSSVRHGIAGVCDEVEENLVDLAGVDEDVKFLFRQPD